MGQHVWLLLATVFTELIVIVKWWNQQEGTTRQMPEYVKVGWAIGFTVLGVVYPIVQVRAFFHILRVERKRI